MQKANNQKKYKNAAVVSLPSFVTGLQVRMAKQEN